MTDRARVAKGEQAVKPGQQGRGESAENRGFDFPLQDGEKRSASGSALPPSPRGLGGDAGEAARGSSPGRCEREIGARCAPLPVSGALPCRGARTTVTIRFSSSQFSI